jgi:hypothetical protein
LSHEQARQVPDFFVRVSAAAKPIVFLRPIFFVAGQVVCTLVREPVFDLRAYTIPSSRSAGLPPIFFLPYSAWASRRWSFFSVGFLIYRPSSCVLNLLFSTAQVFIYFLSDLVDGWLFSVLP